VAWGGSCPEELELMLKLVKLSDAERRRIIHQFIDEAFGDLDANPDLASEQARLVLADLVGRYVQTFGKVDTPDYRSKLVIRLQIANDPRVERYWHLLATINGWPIPPTLAPVFEWFIQALEHHPDPTTTPY
jgi:hypothetical protein